MDIDINYNEAIRQTGRTMIIDRFNDERFGLDSQLKAWGGSENDRIIKRINERDSADTLLVHTFEEFLKHFEPTVYCYQRVTGEGRFAVFYDQRAQINGEFGRPVKLTDEPFYKAVREVLNRKADSGQASLDFDYQSVLDEFMSPKMERERARKSRKDVEFLDAKAREAQKMGRNESALEYRRKRDREIRKVIDKYSRNPLAMMPLLLEDINTAIEERAKGLPESGTGETEFGGYIDLTWDENGKLVPKERDSRTPLLEAGKGEALTTVKSGALATAERGRDKPSLLPALWGKVLSQPQMSGIKENSFLSQSFLSVFSSGSIQVYEQSDDAHLQALKDQYLDFYKESQQSYIDAVADMTRKVLDVEMFFRHAGDQNGYFKEGVLITNCTVRDLLEREESFDDFLEQYSNGDLAKRKIWLAVLPSALDSGKRYQKSVSGYEEVDLDDIDFDADGEDKKTDLSGLDMASVKKMCEKLLQRRILPFFNFNATKDTCTGALNIAELDYYREEMKAIPNRAVFAYPNFLVVDRNEGRVFIGKQSDGSDALLHMPDVFLDAAYVAAGTVAAVQSADRLKQHGYGPREITDTNPCVHFDLETNDAKSRFMTCINKESISMKSREFNERMGRERMGFFFGMDYTHMNMVVQQACTVSGDDPRQKAGLPVKTALTENYIDAYIRSQLPNTPKESDIQEQIERINVREAVSAKERKGTLNPLLNADKGEKITWDSESHKIMVRLDKQALAIDFVVAQTND
ncbi:MAG: hypothetical protein IJQ81_11380 [Oscillibacter sp.]|nr:hypothetical protein [Oscillibacter sp.]